MPRIIATLILFNSLFSNVTQSAADTGVCRFGILKHEFDFYKPYNCKNGDTAIYYVDLEIFFPEPVRFKAYNCDLDKKIIEEVTTDCITDYKYRTIICTFLKKVVRE